MPKGFAEPRRPPSPLSRREHTLRPLEHGEEDALVHDYTRGPLREWSHDVPRALVAMRDEVLARAPKPPPRQDYRPAGKYRVVSHRSPAKGR